MRIGIVALLTIALPAGVSAQLPPPIIDMHLHAMPADGQGPPGTGQCLPALPREAATSGSAWPAEFGAASASPPCDDPAWSPMTDDELMEATLEIMERRNVIGVTSGVRLPQWQAAGGDRIIPGSRYLLHMSPPPPLDSLRRQMAAGTLRVLSEVTIQYSGIEPDDDVFQPYVQLADEMDVPVGIHVGTGPPGAPYLGFRNYRARLHSPLLYEELLLRHPDLRVYLMHAGWPMLDDLLAVLWAHPQVYVEVGVIDWALPPAEFHRYLRTIVEAGFGKRVMFGSDQMVWPGALEFAIDNIESADYLSAEQKRDILYHNAARFLRLGEEEIARHYGR